MFLFAGCVFRKHFHQFIYCNVLLFIYYYHNILKYTATDNGLIILFLSFNKNYFYIASKDSTIFTLPQKKGTR